MTTPSLLNWMLLSTLSLGACWLLYRLALRSERSFGYNRIYLIFTALLAAILPLVPLRLPWLVISSGAARLMPSVLLPAVQVRADEQAGLFSNNTSFCISIIYILVASGFLYRLASQLWRLWRLTRRLPREEHAGYTLVRTGGRLPISSFGRTIFWDETASLSATDREQILRHEQAHVQQGHSWDRLALEVLRAVLWFNPFAHLYPRALALTHEYLADEAALREAPATVTPTAYAALLAAQTSARLGFSLSLQHSFTQSQTLNRIAMLHHQNPIRRWKQWLALPVGGLLFFTVACEKAVAPANPTATLQQSQVVPPPPPKLLPAPPPPPPPALTGLEVMPEYQGGQGQLLKDVISRLQYPEVAKKVHLEGKVFVSFVVGADGQIHGVKVLKGIAAPAGLQAAAQAMNDEARRVVATLPGTWQPGRQGGKTVDVSFGVPITYAIR